MSNPFCGVGLVLRLTVWWIMPAARAQPAGSLELSFTDSKINGGASITPPTDGKLVVSGGSLYLSAPFTFLNAVRLNDEGTVDPTFSALGNAVQGHALLPRGRLFVFGSFTTIGTLATRNLVILKADGSPDPGFVAGTLAANNPPPSRSDLLLRSRRKLSVAEERGESAGKTSNRLDLTNVTAADVGFYRCVIRYRSYTETSTAGERRLSGAVVPPPVLTLAPSTPGATSCTIPSWPAGFFRQRTASLVPAEWQTYATLPPVTIPFTQPAGFFRLVTAS